MNKFSPSRNKGHGESGGRSILISGAGAAGQTLGYWLRRKKAFEGDTTWGVQTLLQGLRASTDLYFDEVSQIHMDSWSNGRVSLVGDAVSVASAANAIELKNYELA